jgi:hypothetical protein
MDLLTNLSHYKKLTKKGMEKICPKCLQNTLVVSIFGSICGNCLFDPKPAEGNCNKQICDITLCSKMHDGYEGSVNSAVKVSPHTPLKEESWEEEFDRKFEVVKWKKTEREVFDSCEGGYCGISVEEVKAFISQARHQAVQSYQEDIIKLVEEMKRNDTLSTIGNIDFPNKFYNQAISEVINKIKTRK